MLSSTFPQPQLRHRGRGPSSREELKHAGSVTHDTRVSRQEHRDDRERRPLPLIDAFAAVTSLLGLLRQKGNPPHGGLGVVRFGEVTSRGGVPHRNVTPDPV